MARYVVSRILQAVVVVWIVITLVFVVVRLTPGDAARNIGGPDATKEQLEEIRDQLGLNDSIPQQYVSYLGRILRGDFRDSIKYQEPAMSMVMDRFPNTLKLAVIAFVISVGIGGLIGVGSALRPGGIIDRFGKLFAVFGQAMPSFWVGLLGILIFAVKLGWLPAAGMGSWKTYILPGFTLGWFSMAAMMRLTRSAMLDVLETDFVKMLRIKGLPMRNVVFKHALRNASIPILTLASLQLVAFLSGSVVVETVFAWPGVGKLMTESVTARDYTVVQAGAFLICTTLVGVNLLVDLTYAVIDPRIRYA